MGSKGSQTSNTAQNQSQSYVPTGGGYMVNALNQGAAASQLPFNVPQAPVAGFSNDQQQAFQDIRNSQGMAQPYFNQAGNYFNQSAQGPDISQFFNPYAGAVTDQLKNIFGQQMSQATGQLTQAAGGVGADRIAVGQSQLANQQGLAAGQTLAGIYGPSLQAAQQEQNIQQGAGYGLGALGPAAQNSAMMGSQQLLGTGGLQQQLQQAQLNSPYQQQLAQSAFPYQQAQFNAGITGSLAPGLGGITAGSGTGLQSQPGPSWLSTILGGGLTAAGIAGGLGWLPFAAKGGVIHGYDNGGRVGYDGGGGVADNPYVRAAEINELKRDDQNFSPYMPSLPQLPANINGQPITTSPTLIPKIQGGQSRSNMPALSFNLNAPAAQNPDSGMMSLVKEASKFANSEANGGVVRGYADGGDTDNTDDAHPYGYGGEQTTPAANLAASGTLDTDIGNSGSYSSGNGIIGYGSSDAALPTIDPGTVASGTTDSDVGTPSPYGMDDTPSQSAMDAQASADDGARSGEEEQHGPAADDRSKKRRSGFMQSPWMALTAAGLGMMASKSPWAGVALGEGGLQGMKVLQQQREAAQKDETIDQAARRLDQEADYHQKQIDIAKVPPGFLKGDKGSLVVMPGGPHDPKQIKAEADAKRPEGMNDEDMQPLLEQYKAGDRTGVLSSISRGAQGPANITKFWHMLSLDLQSEGKTGKDLAAARADFMAASAAARVAAQREATVDTAVNEAKGTFPALEKASLALPRTSFTPFNQALQFFREKTGSPEQRAYGAALQAAVTGYSQAMTRTGGNSVYAQQHAASVLNAADGHEALMGAIKQLNIEMAIAKAAPAETRQDILDHILNPSTSAGAPPATAAPAAAPAAGAAQPKNGERKQFKQGWGVWDGQKWVPEKP